MYASGMATQSLAELAEEERRRQAAEDKLSEEVTRGVQTETAMMESFFMVQTAGYLDDVVNEEGLQNDTQTAHFCNLLKVATNFACTNLSANIKHVPVLVNNLRDLLLEIRREQTEYAAIANELEDLMISFSRMVLETKEQAARLYNHLDVISDEIQILEDALSAEKWTSQDKKDAATAIDQLHKGAQNSIKFAEERKAENKALDERAGHLKKIVNDKQVIIKGRLNLFGNSAISPTAGILGGVLCGGSGTITGLLGAEALLIGSVAVSPLVAVVFGAAIVGVGIGVIVKMVQNFFVNHNTKGLHTLKEIYKQLIVLQAANVSFTKSITDFGTPADQLHKTTGNLCLALERGQDRRMRIVFAKLCKTALQATKQTMESLRELKDFNIDWLTTSKITEMPRASYTNNSLKSLTW
eukprot:TRINITY_DN6544_c0_g1_i2.p1 TRINITY_DN6544_c0_g1~~TRINITY_DN6544_c0_g1_i2.p1  ORF type:complete len:413 (-),score=54.57 TRINITY_DN6544_c0_g1_i2:103-1341(-)